MKDKLKAVAAFILLCGMVTVAAEVQDARYDRMEYRTAQ